ncbi:MAG: T9SS type A sorting domain-containing protein [Saprospiraceae bacterium]
MLWLWHVTNPVDEPVSDAALIKFCKEKYDPVIRRSDWEEIESSFSLELPQEINVYPNPFSDHFNLAIPEAWIEQELTLSLVDITGRMVWETHYIFPMPGVQNFQNYFDHLSPGTYIFQITGKKATVTLPLQKY